MLAGTGLDIASKRRGQRLLDTLTMVESAWPSKDPLPSSIKFLRAASIVSSRSFYVDELQGEGLLPLVDSSRDLHAQQETRCF